MSELYCVYKHTTPNGKVYIGQTKAGVESRWKNGKGYTCHHHGYFWKAIEKYGWNNIKHEILYDNLTKESADYYEQFFIEIYKSTDSRYGYNCQSGGSRNYKYSVQAKKNISEGLKQFYRKNGKPDTSRARAILQKQQGRRIVQYDMNGIRIAEYESAYDAFLQTGISNKKINVCLCVPERNKSAGGYMWRYYENAPDRLPCSKKPKIIYVDNLNNILGVYTSIREAAEKTGINASTIGNVLRHRFKTSKTLQNQTFIYEYEVEHEDLKLKEVE